MKNVSRLLIRAKYYGIPEKVLLRIVDRDKVCIYCHRKMKRHLNTIGNPSDKATIEHFSDVGVWNETRDVGICCSRCNASKSNKKLSQWFKTKYCIQKNINERTVAKPIKDYVRKMGKKY